jgi:hypothetical protein
MRLNVTVVTVALFSSHGICAFHSLDQFIETFALFGAGAEVAFDAALLAKGF